MYKVVGKQLLNKTTKKIEVRAPELCGKLAVGQFIVLTPHANCDPVTISSVDVDPMKGTLTVVFEESNEGLIKLGELKIGDEVYAIEGPLGEGFSAEKYGRVVCVSEGGYVLNNLKLCRVLQAKGNKVIGIAGFKTKAEMLLAGQFRSNCDNAIVVTEDGSHDRKGDLSGVLSDVLDERQVDCVFAVGSFHLLQVIKDIASEKGSRCFVDLAAILKEGVRGQYESRLRINGQRTYLGFSPLIREASEVDLKDIIQQLQEIKEYNDCQQLMSKQSVLKNGSKTFAKLFAGLVGNKQ